MTKKKTAKKVEKKYVVANSPVIAKPITLNFEPASNTCKLCDFFTINGEGAKRGVCRRYPTAINKNITDYCGEYK